MRNHSSRAVTGLTIAISLATSLAACSSGDDGPKCDLDENPTTLAIAEEGGAAWPRFRRDQANSGRIDGVVLPRDPNRIWTFPCDQALTVGAINGSALVAKDGNVLLVARSTDPDSPDQKIYELKPQDGDILNNVTPTPETTPTVTVEPTPGPPSITMSTTISGTPLLGADDTIFAAFGDGSLLRFNTIGEETYSTFLAGFIAGSPNIGTDGTIYIASTSGVLSAVCPNGVPRFNFGIGETESTAAVTADQNIIIAGGDGRVRAFELKGRQLWLFFATASVRGAVVLDESADEPSFFVADTSGHVYRGRLSDGALLASQNVGQGYAISASPALGRDGTLYVADEGGVLHALDSTTLSPRWHVQLGGPIRSSPAVASDGTDDVVVVADGSGALHAIANRGTSFEHYWDSPLLIDEADGGFGTSSPSISFDGNIYIGTVGGRLYAFGEGAETACPMTALTPSPTPSPSPSPTPPQS